MSTFRIKRFSIESGYPDSKGTLLKELFHRITDKAAFSGGLVGALFGISGLLEGGLKDIKTTAKVAGMGLSIGLIVNALAGICNALSANRRKKELKGYTMKKALSNVNSMVMWGRNEEKLGNTVFFDGVKMQGVQVNGDPNKFKINMDLQNGIALLTLKNPDKIMLQSLNKVLDKMISRNRLATYTSKKTSDGYLIAIDLPSQFDCDNFILDLTTLNQEGDDWVINCIL